MPSYKDWIRKINIEVDYFSAFIKAWIAFNALYRNEYRECTDRDIIKKLKSESNHFKGYIETLLDENSNTDDTIVLRNNLTSLQSALVEVPIFTQERGGVNQQISFSEIAINNPKNLSEDDYRTTHYQVQRTSQSVKTLLHKKNSPTDIYFSFEQEKYDETALHIHPDLLRLGSERQRQCKAFYKEVCPYVIESVICKNRDLLPSLQK